MEEVSDVGSTPTISTKKWWIRV